MNRSTATEPLPSLPEAHATVSVPVRGTWLRKLLAFSGPGLLVAVGYMDPGNWATDLAGGARYGYLLLSVIFLSNLMAMLLQHLALKLGVATGRDLAQACRDYYPKPAAFALWGLCEAAIVACDLAEVIGSAIALNLLFNLPLVVGILLTAADVIVLLFLFGRNFRVIEGIVASLILLIGGCFAYELIVAKPDLASAFSHLVPRARIVLDPGVLFIAIGILGATVMPHNLYLHSSIIQTRNYPRTPEGRAMAVRFGTIDSTVSLGAAFFVNAAILMLSAAAFHGTQYESVADITDAYKLLTPALGDPYAGILFAVALLASGQNSTVTGTMAGQIVMEGFLRIRLAPWMRRLLTRSLAIVPACFAAIYWGDKGITNLLLWSQVVLSLQLSFAVVPLVSFTSDAAKMGEFRNATWLRVLSWAVAIAIAGLNGWLIVDFLRS